MIGVKGQGRVTVKMGGYLGVRNDHLTHTFMYLSAIIKAEHDNKGLETIIWKLQRTCTWRCEELPIQFPCVHAIDV